MSRPNRAAFEPSPADFYPSPPTSPKAVKVVDKLGLSKTIPGAEAELSIDSIASSKLPATQKEHARPVTPGESTASEDEESGETEEESELSTWKTALSLSNMTCGATRKDNKLCENKISVKKTKTMDDIIKLLWTPSISSLETETHLDNLAKLAHCHYHDHPPVRAARTRHWMTVLPGAPRLLSPQKRLRDILGAAPSKCTSVKKNGDPCGNKIGPERRFYGEKTIKKMIQVALEPAEEDDSLTLLAKVLQHYMLCRVHQVQPYKHQDDWMRRINKFRAACQNERNATGVEQKVEREMTAKCVDINRDESKLASPPPSPRIHKATEDPATYWDTGYEIGQFDILGRFYSVDEHKITAEEIRKTAEGLLNTDRDKSENEVNSGFVYLYQVPGNDSLVKIGFTTDDVAKRLEKWKKDCHREPAALYPAAAAAAAAAAATRSTAIPHAHRVERLVHAELMEHRVRLYCERCEKQHVEWFETSVERAVAVIEKWSRWIQGRPYEQRRTRQGVSWYLKEAEAQRLADVPKFLSDLAKATEGTETM
ncbi:hypothetical protein V2A60_009450 [Cordyceps javanica]